MKKLIVFISLAISASDVAAQQARAFTMPAIFGQVTGPNEVGRPVTLTGGNTLLENDVIIDPAAKTLTTISKEDYRFVSQRPYQLVRHSPDGHYRVIVRFAVNTSYKLAESRKDVDDWQVLGYSTTGEDWKFDLRNSDYPLGVTNKGELITTEPKVYYKYSKALRTHMNLEITAMQGLWLFNPKTGERKLISKDVLYKNVKADLTISMNQAGERLTVAYYADGKTNIETYDVQTGQHWHVELPVCNFRQIGNTVAMINEFHWVEGHDASLIKIISLADGRELLSEQASDSAGFGSDTWCHNLTLYGDELYFMNKLNYSVARLKPQDGKMVMAGIVQLDTAGLLLKNHDYYLGVLNNYLALIPFNISFMESQNPYPIFGYFFDRKGSPQLAMRPFFVQPPSAGDVAAKAAAEKQECDRAITNSPFPIGALVRKKGEGDCTKAPLIWGVECGYNSYTTTSFQGGRNSFCKAADYELCDAGPYAICTKCKGTGSIKRWSAVSDDGWKQVNFNVYVRNPNGVKGVELDGVCDQCGGKKIVRL
ncbi:MAG: hypothetical protein ABJA78_17635 [Ferruginibacter sp.]